MKTKCNVCKQDYETYLIILDDNALSWISEMEFRDKYYKDGKGLCEKCREEKLK